MLAKIEKDGKKKLVVASKTPSKSRYQDLNRQERRAIIFKNPVKRLLEDILEIREAMKEAEIPTIPMPKFKNKKVLSGYKSKLISIIKENE